MVVLRVACRIEQRDLALTRRIDDIFQAALTFRGVEFLLIAVAELDPAGRVVPKPFAQFGGGRDLLFPRVELQVGFADTPRPQAVDQNAIAIAFYRLERDRKSTRLNSSHVKISYAVF